MKQGQNNQLFVMKQGQKSQLFVIKQRFNQIHPKLRLTFHLQFKFNYQSFSIHTILLKKTR